MSQKRMFEVKCTECGKSTTVPFEPTKGKPVYCRPCLTKKRNAPKEVSTVSYEMFNMKNAWARRNDKCKKKQKPHTVFKSY
ncbi:MAG: hypothetical protein NWF03_08270 [Candidatus Bathyarchaeota archaeon]|nr:hypothetical protein [Candidatus Bathyarchaeota archaeon]